VARLLLGVSGGIAAYKALEFVRLATQGGHRVRVIQTPRSEHFVGRASFEALTGAPVLGDEFEPDPLRGSYPGESAPERAPITHLALVARAELYVIAPASANTLAKLAHGHADNLLCTAALAAECPVLVAPAMNDHMFRHPATAANLDTLAARGVQVIPPGVGRLASHGEHGVGRLAEPSELLAVCEAALAAHGEPRLSAFNRRRVLVTAGGTREPIDSVRYIGNRSSGRMGYALAQRAAARGAQVTVLAANVALPDPPGVQVIPVSTAAELAAAAEREFAGADILLMAAAVADFRPVRAAAHKLKKDQGVPALALEPTVDVLSRLSEGRRQGQLLVGFAAEHGAGAINYGREKLTRKGLDVIVVNDISLPDIGFDSEANEVTILAASGRERQIAKASKAAVADAILDELELALEAVRQEGTHGTRAGSPAPA
jgi:phosphopantothenoylcysteine decarboxylase / phosphopantothenate---cysteine ligase